MAPAFRATWPDKDLVARNSFQPLPAHTLMGAVLPLFITCLLNDYRSTTWDCFLAIMVAIVTIQPIKDTLYFRFKG